MAALVDVNVLVALLYEGHAHNVAAFAWLDGMSGTGSVALCRVAQIGALRIMTNRSVLREDAIAPREFWRGWDRMSDDDRFSLVAEPPTIEPVWREVARALPSGAVADTDVFLAAFARAGDHTLVTFDRGFRRFRGLQLELLSG